MNNLIGDQGESIALESEAQSDSDDTLSMNVRIPTPQKSTFKFNKNQELPERNIEQGTLNFADGSTYQGELLILVNGITARHGFGSFFRD